MHTLVEKSRHLKEFWGHSVFFIFIIQPKASEEPKKLQTKFLQKSQDLMYKSLDNSLVSFSKWDFPPSKKVNSEKIWCRF